jgi:3-methyladenine DNA glycosylase AlkD
MSDFVSEIKHVFEENANAEKAIEMKQYMKNLFPFLGIQSPQRRLLSKPIFEHSKSMPIEELKSIIHELWLLPEREYQYFALDLIDKNFKKFDESSIALFEKLILNKSWWDTVDVISVKLVGGYFKKYPQKLDSITNRWNIDANMWLNRASILFQLSYKLDTNIDLLVKYTLKHKESKEFFTQKAIGWALREYAKFNQKFVVELLSKQQFQVLSVREALKHLSQKRIII